MKDNLEGEVQIESNPIQIDENITIHLLGTAHVSEQSVLEVEKLLQVLQPTELCVELCRNRYGMLKNKINLDLTFFEIYKNSDSILKAVLSYFNISIAKKLGTIPGGEFRKAYEIACNEGIPVHLVDRDVGVTLRRCWGFLNTWKRIRFMYNLCMAAITGVSKEEIETLKESDVLSQFMLEFGKEFPELLQVLIDERDQFMAKRVLEISTNCRKTRREYDLKRDEMMKAIKERSTQEKIEEIKGDDFKETLDLQSTIRNDFLDSPEDFLEEMEPDVIFCVVGAGHVAGMSNYIKNPHLITKPQPIPPSYGFLYAFGGIIMLLSVILYYFFK